MAARRPLVIPSAPPPGLNEAIAASTQAKVRASTAAELAQTLLASGDIGAAVKQIGVAARLAAESAALAAAVAKQCRPGDVPPEVCGNMAEGATVSAEGARMLGATAQAVGMSEVAKQCIDAADHADRVARENDLARANAAVEKCKALGAAGMNDMAAHFKRAAGNDGR